MFTFPRGGLCAWLFHRVVMLRVTRLPFHPTIVSPLAYVLPQLSLFCQDCRADSMVETKCISLKDPGRFCGELIQLIDSQSTFVSRLVSRWTFRSAGAAPPIAEVHCRHGRIQSCAPFLNGHSRQLVSSFPPACVLK